MHKHLKTIKRYETRDGQKFDDHEIAIRHEYYHAIPKQLAQLIAAKVLSEIPAHTARMVAEAIMSDAQNVIHILQDFLENAETVADFDRTRQQRETVTRVLREKGINPVKDAMEAGDA